MLGLDTELKQTRFYQELFTLAEAMLDFREVADLERWRAR